MVVTVVVEGELEKTCTNSFQFPAEITSQPVASIGD